MEQTLVVELPVLREKLPPCRDYDEDCHAKPFNFIGHALGEPLEIQYLNCWLWKPGRGYCVMLSPDSRPS